MKIKTKKKMYIGGLLEYVRKNELRGRYFRVMDESRYIKVTPDGDIYFDVDFRFRPDDIFTIEVTEKLTEETLFREVVIVVKNDDGHSTSYTTYDETLKDAVNKRPKIYKVYSLINGSLHLIWSRESGIPESGVLEVSE